MYTRRCVITKLQDLAMDKYREIVSQNAGALLVLLPQNLTELPNEVKEVGLWRQTGFFVSICIFKQLIVDL